MNITQTDPKFNSLVRLLNSTDPAMLDAIYGGVGYWYVNAAKDSELNIVAIKTFVKNLNSIAVVDRSRLENVINRYVVFKSTPFEPLTDFISKAKSFEECLTIGTLFGEGHVNNINNNLSYFKQTTMALRSVVKLND